MKNLVGVWLIVIYALISTLTAAGALYSYFTGFPANAPQPGTTDIALSMAYHVCFAAGAICLFLQPRLALILFIAAAVLDVIGLVVHLQAPGALDNMSALAWGFLAVEWAMMLAIILYTAGLAKTPSEADA